MAGAVERFDHVVVAVHDLEAAMSFYRHLGFEVSAGGRHTGRGTHNAIIRFGLDYIELLAIYDKDEEHAHGGELSAFMERNGGGLVAFAVATSSIEDIAAGWRSEFAPVDKPEPMERLRPDGFLLSWRLLIPGGSPWGKPWPFIIQWDTPDADRLARDAPGKHANGATGIAGVTVATRAPDRLVPLYVDDLGFALEAHDLLKLNECTVRLTEGQAERPVEVQLEVPGGTAPLRLPSA